MDREGKIVHSQVFTHFARYQEGRKPVISPRRHVYVTMVRATSLRVHMYGTSGGGKWGSLRSLRSLHGGMMSLRREFKIGRAHV